MEPTQTKVYLSPTQVPLRADQREWARQQSQRTGLSMAEIFRTALDDYRQKCETEAAR